MSAFWPHADSPEWWDGPDRFKRVNRCEVAIIQNETLLRMLGTLPSRKLDVGGPTFPPETDILAGFDVCNLVSRPGVTRVCDACDTPYEDSDFRAVFSSHVIEHVHNVDAFLRESARILQSGGLLYIVCPDRRHFLHSDSGAAVKTLPDGERTYEEFTPDELLARVRRVLPRFDVLSFDTRQNNLDFEICARKVA